jgi:hypothetical protein
MPTLRQCPRTVTTVGRQNAPIAPRTNGLGTGLKWLVACSVRVEFSSVLRESDLFVDLDLLAEKALFDVRKESRDQETPNSQRGVLWQSS